MFLLFISQVRAVKQASHHINTHQPSYFAHFSSLLFQIFISHPSPQSHILDDTYLQTRHVLERKKTQLFSSLGHIRVGVAVVKYHLYLDFDVREAGTDVHSTSASNMIYDDDTKMMAVSALSMPTVPSNICIRLIYNAYRNKHI